MAAKSILRSSRGSTQTRVWVIGVNDSDAAKNAFAEVISLMNEGDALHAVIVASQCDGSTLPPGAPVVESMLSKLRERETTRCNESLAYYEAKAARLGLNFTTHTVFASLPGEAICEKARELHSHFIVVGQRLEIASSLTKSLEKAHRVSQYLIDHAPCHVLVIRSSAERPSLQRSDTQEIRRKKMETERDDLINQLVKGTGRAAMSSSVAVGYDEAPTLAETILSSSPSDQNRLDC